MGTGFRSEPFAGYTPQIQTVIVFGEYSWNTLVSASAYSPWPRNKTLLSEYWINPTYYRNNPHAKLVTGSLGYLGPSQYPGPLMWELPATLNDTCIAMLRIAGEDDPHLGVWVTTRSYNGGTDLAMIRYRIVKEDGTLAGAWGETAYQYTPGHWYLGFMYDVENGYFCIFPFVRDLDPISGSNAYRWTFINSNCAFNNYILSPDYNNAWGYEENPIEGVDTEYGEYSTEQGYEGVSFDDSSDIINVPAVPGISMATGGFIHIYNPTVAELQNIIAEIFPAPTIPAVASGNTLQEVVDNLAALANSVVQLFTIIANQNLINNVIDCHILPVAPAQGLASGVIVGYKTLTTTPLTVTGDYIDFDCGELTVDEYYSNFADYSPFTEAQLFLPFVGYVPILMEYVSGGTIKIVYRFNVIEGSFMAYIIVTSAKSNLSNSVVGQYSGTACLHIPITGTNYGNMLSNIVDAGANLAKSGLSISNVRSGISALMSHPDVVMSNGYSGAAAFMSVRTPFLLIGRPVSDFSEKYPHEKGLPSNITETIGDLSGFTIVKDPDLSGFSAMEVEKAEIAALLETGVIL